MKLADGTLLPEVAAPDRPVCLTTWLGHDAGLLTADQGGTIHRWEFDLGVQRSSSQHMDAVTLVRFTKDGVVSRTEQECRIWRDGALVATILASENYSRCFYVDDDGDQLVDTTDSQSMVYSLIDGTDLGTHRDPPVELSWRVIRSARARLSVSLRWDLRTTSCTGLWTAPTTLQSVDVRADGSVVVGDLGGTVTWLQ